MLLFLFLLLVRHLLEIPGQQLGLTAQPIPGMALITQNVVLLLVVLVPMAQARATAAQAVLPDRVGDRRSMREVAAEISLAQVAADRPVAVVQRGHPALVVLAWTMRLRLPISPPQEARQTMEQQRAVPSPLTETTEQNLMHLMGAVLAGVEILPPESPEETAEVMAQAVGGAEIQILQQVAMEIRV